MFRQSSHSEIMAIIYLINHSTSKLFNEVCILNNTAQYRNFWILPRIKGKDVTVHGFRGSEVQSSHQI
jgi:hypothetical protein